LPKDSETNKQPKRKEAGEEIEAAHIPVREINGFGELSKFQFQLFTKKGVKLFPIISNTSTHSRRRRGPSHSKCYFHILKEKLQ
jgi:hypothetical protein